MSTETRDERPVRTYRGRSLQELIPKIREELGPDAIILREREGLTGGFNGFFQQRCVEVDAQAPPSVDFYDDDEDALPGDEPGAAAESDDLSAPSAPSAPAPRGGWPHETAPAATPPAVPAPAPVPAHTPYSDAAQSYTATPYRPPTPAQPQAEQPQAAAQPEPDPQAQAPAQPEADPQPQAPAQPDPDPLAPEPSYPAAPAPDETPAQAPALATASDAPAELGFAQRLAQARRERATAIPEAQHPEPAPPAPASEMATPTPAADVDQPEAAAPSPDAHSDQPEADPAPTRGNLRVVDSPAGSGATVTPIPSAPTRDGGPRRPPTTLRPFPGAPAPAPGGQLDSVLAGAIARELTGQGISEAWAHELIVTAAAHLTPFTASADLRAGVRAVIAGGIMAPPPLPSSGAAVAFVGPGGSGKSRCTAALAAAYGRASTLQARVVSLGGGPRAADVAGLLADRDVPVELLRGAAAADAIARGRERGLVVVDTDTISPVDAQSIAALADTLAPLGLDAIYLTLPATMSATAARGLLDGLEALAPSALVITHADEANELGIVAELAYLSGLPIAFIHGGLELDAALIATDPAGIAARVLP
jgi:flagellar biosynthesis GTPase FlhF